MTNPPEPNNLPNSEPDPSREPRSPRSNRRWRRLLVPGSIVLVGAAGAAWWGYGVLKQQLPIIVERELEKSLERPVELGPVESLTLSGIRVGRSVMPPTATDKDTLTVESLDIRFNILKILWTRNLYLNITANRPTIYVDQNKAGEWLQITLPEQDETKPGRSDLDTITLKDADVTLVPWAKYGDKPAKPIRIQPANGTVRLSEQGRQINFEVEGRSLTGGDINLIGSSLRLPRADVPEERSPNLIKLQARTQNFLASEIDRLIKFPVSLEAGRVNANVGVEFDPRRENPALDGTAQFQGIQLQIPNAPAPIRQANGTLRLKDTVLSLEDTSGLFGRVPLTAAGDIDIDKGFNLTATVKSARLPDVLTSLNLKSPVPLAGNAAADLKITGPVERPILSGEARSVSALRVDRVNLDRLSTRFRLDLENQRFTIAELTAVPQGGGQVTGRGDVRLSKQPQLALNFQVRNALVDPVVRNYATDVQVPPIGRVNATGSITGPSDRALVRLSQIALQPPEGGSVTGQGTVQLGEAEPQLAFQFTANQVPGNAIARTYANVQNAPLDVGLVDARATITGTSQNLLIALNNLVARPQQGGSISGSGEVRVRQGTPNLALSFQANDLPGDGIVRAFVSPSVLPLAIGRVNGRADLSGTTENLLVRIPNLAVRPPSGGSVTASGSVRLVNQQPQLALNFQANDLSGNAIARAYNQGRPAPVELGAIQAQGAIAGSLSAPRITADARIPVEGGVVDAELRASGGRWQANLNSTNVNLAGISPELRGQLDGQLTASGSVASFRPGSIRASGQVRLSEGVSLINRPITADLRWDGQKVVIDRAVGPGFSAAGFLFARLEGAGAPALTGFDLNVRTRDLSLQALEIPLPVNVPYSGVVDFNGRVQGSPAAPRVRGDVALRNFRLNETAFESPLTGTIVVDNGVRLNLNGQRDLIALTLSPDYRPIAFEIRSDQIYAQGTGQGDVLTIQARNFPLAIANIPGALPYPVSGTLSTDQLTVNLRTFEVTGQVNVAQPAIGTFQADNFLGLISFANGIARLEDAKLVRIQRGPGGEELGRTTIEISATANLQQPDPRFTGEIAIADGRVQDVLELLQVFDLSDFARNTPQPNFGTAADLQTTPVALGNNSVLEQLQRLAEVRKLLEQAEAERQQAAIPQLQELRGGFDASIKASGSLRGGITAQFNLEGQNWQWRNYEAQQVIVSGGFENGVLTLLPVRVQSGDAVVTFSGQLLGEEQSGQLRMVNVPIDAIKEFASASTGGQLAQSLQSVAVDGKLNATATLSGRFVNPQAVGEITIAEGSLNGTAIQSAQGSFQYSDARLDFGSSVLITGDDPIRISGSLPYRLPFAEVTPRSSDIALDIDVRDEGLVLLNLLNNQVAWVDGQGEVQLKVRGTLLRPDVDGFARIENATIAARALPEPLTNTSGLVRFDDDRITIEQPVTGQFSRGKVSATGVIPLVAPFIETDPNFGSAIAVTLENLNLNLKGLYRGGVNGRVEVGGTALTPVLTGVINLSNGEVLLASTQDGNGAAPDDPNGTPTATAPVEFRDLRIELGDRLRVTSAPILNFVARGELIVNGTLNELEPQGVITLTAGQVNLFTTQFTLDRGYPQVAIFEPNRGLDPILNVRLIASVPEVRGRFTTGTTTTEISESVIPASQIGGLQTVRVQAAVNGPASQIFENLELTSSPSRTETEIVSLIGGGFITTLGRGDSLLGIANLAGSALLTNIQTTIGNAIGLSEFRLFPTLTREDTAEDSGNNNPSTLGLAAEAAVDITSNVSVSVLKIVTNDDPFQFGVRYRINDRTLIRGSTDFSGDSRLQIEYEARF